MNRYTPRDLQRRIEQVNQGLTEAGSLTRFEYGGRNGWQAVDEYSVDEDGNRIGSHVNRNIELGTSRECAAALERAYSSELENLRRMQNS